MLARQDVGRREQAAWPPASTAFAIASSATTVLPLPTSPCSRRSIRVGSAMSATISASACSWDFVRV